jgi:hypothetical protein
MSLVPGFPDLIHRQCIYVLVGWEEKESTCQQDHQFKCKNRINVDMRDLRKIGESVLQGSDDASTGKMLPLFQRQHVPLNHRTPPAQRHYVTNQKFKNKSVHRPPASATKIMPNKIAATNTMASKFVQYLK